MRVHGAMVGHGTQGLRRPSLRGALALVRWPVHAVQRIDTDLFDPDAYDEVIDVRSAGEYAEDHVPGAMSLPVLDDAQRVEVGVCYKRNSAFAARRLGAGYVSANIATMMREHFADKPPDYRPLVYCWRGGQRSGALAHVLERVGWNVHVLAHGYKTFRRRARVDLERLPAGLHFHVLAGLTGTGKTDVLKELAARGEQVLDLEALAHHQGSLLGEPPEGQNTSQKKFESSLWDALRRFDRERVVWTEAESAKIGQVICPKDLLHRIRSGQVFELEASLDERSRYLNARYQWWQVNPGTLRDKLARLTERHGHQEIARWNALIDAQRWEAFVARLLALHYDPSYLRSRARNFSEPRARVRIEKLCENGAAAAAGELMGYGTSPGACTAR